MRPARKHTTRSLNGALRRVVFRHRSARGALSEGRPNRAGKAGLHGSPQGADEHGDARAMFAVIKTGGKQYKVAAEDVLTIEKLEAEAGAEVRFDEVLMIVDGEAVTVGAPRVVGAGVRAEVVEQTKGPKVIATKKRRRKHSSMTRKGHRQKLTQVRILEILSAEA